ncbi:MAG: hypothetical protein IKA50_00980 [Clostridia bacterium]|nr:hypothetical protein [Clostridia bacterium]
MNDVQQKLLTLLTDLDAICQREGIQYYLCKETALAAYTQEGFYPSCCEVNVAMATDDALHFIRAVKKENRADRTIDSMYSNKNYPEFTVRYGDANTLMMKLPFNNASYLPNIAVTIHMIRYKSAKAVKLYRRTRALWKACVKPTIAVAGVARRSAVLLCHTGKNMLGGRLFSRSLFKMWVRIHSHKNDKNVSICAGHYTFPAALLQGTATVTFEGHTFPTFADPEVYLLKEYGKNWATCKPAYLVPSSSLPVSANVSYREYLRRTKSQINYRAIQKKKFKLDLIQAKVSLYNHKINGYYAVVERTQRRFAMYEMYMPMKDKLVQLHKEEKWDELNELLKPYRSALWACYKKKLGLCFDKDIFEITMDVLLREGSKTYVRKLRAMVPEEHWKPIVITDYKGEPVENVR